MARLTKYLFFIFSFAVILPLVCLFLYSNFQIKKMEKSASNLILESASREVNFKIENHLKLETVRAMEKLYLPTHKDYTKDEIRKIFNDARVEFLDKLPSKITYYYETDETPKLYSTVIIPFLQNDIKGIVITKEVKSEELKLYGPFFIELYSGDEINRNKLIWYVSPIVESRKFPGFTKNLQKIPLGIPEDKRISCKMFNFNENYTKNKMTILIKTNWHISPGNPYARRASLIIIIVGVLLSFFVARYVNVNFINPFLKLSAATKRVYMGDLNLHLKISVKQKTVQETYANFNAMVKGLKERNELRTGFIRNLTHDLRTPLIAQQRALSLISNKFRELNLKEEIDLTQSLENNANHLLRMVNLILESYQFNLKKEDLQLEIADIAALVNESLTKIKPLADEKQIILENLRKPGEVLIKIDKTCFERIIINLAANSIENLKNNGKISISNESTSKEHRIIFEDNGNGIAKEDIEHIFDRYFSSKSYNRKIGSGLGLDVCKKLAEILDGKIDIQSKTGKFTRFIITLQTDGEKRYDDKNIDC